jgi:phosphopantothenoylcysteine decarboxylase/phosphopantothenate--cysteine ligase
MKKTVVVGVSGGIAAYKTCAVVSRLRQLGYDVKVVMTQNATEFVSKLTFETLSNNEVVIDMFAPKSHYDVEHISLAKEADVFLVAPATANVIAKFAQGIADDMLSATFLASKAVKVICPAMNTGMYTDEATQENMNILKERGINILEPESGFLACGEWGKDEWRSLRKSSLLSTNSHTQSRFSRQECDYHRGRHHRGHRGVRYISNYSSGKMGVAIANAFINRGGNVISSRATSASRRPKAVRKSGSSPQSICTTRLWKT